MDQLEAFREAVKRRLNERAEIAINLLGQVRFRPPQPASAGSNQSVVALASYGLEEIALAHTLHQAEAQVLTDMMKAVDEEFRKIMGVPAETAADPAKQAAVEKQEKQRKRGVY